MAQTYLDLLLLSSNVGKADWKASEIYGEKLNYLAWRQEMGSSFLPGRSAGRGHCSFSEHSPDRTTETPSTSLTLLASHSLKLCPDQHLSSPKMFPVDFPYEWLVLAHASDIPKLSQTSSIRLQQDPHLSLNWSRSSTNSSRLQFTAWHYLGTTTPSTSNIHLQIAL